ncbi:unnamed protein product [Closterium sp. NIES-64]|nr:unnamed protein product [Closterium sp. NIES-65]CAI5990417.1 unnamed protein product [Closterium sp. NIES-64]
MPREVPDTAAGSPARSPFSPVPLSTPDGSRAPAASLPAAVASLATGSATDTSPLLPLLPVADPQWLRLMSAEARSAPPVQIIQLEVRPLNVPLREPFTIASATLSAVPNVAIRAVLRIPCAGGKLKVREEKYEIGSEETGMFGWEGDGRGAEENGGSGGMIEVVGWGEAPVLPSVTEEDQETIIEACARARDWMVAQPPMRWHELLLRLEQRVLPGHGLASARAGVEMAVLDALASALALPLWRLFSSSSRPLSTDITIPICSPESAESLARNYHSQGFSCFKIKLGALPPSHSPLPAHALQELSLQSPLVDELAHARQGQVEREWGGREKRRWGEGREEVGVMEGWEAQLVQADLERVVAVQEAVPHCCLLLDANGGYRTAAAVLHLLSRLAEHGISPRVLEQPFHRSNWRAMHSLTAALSHQHHATTCRTSPSPAAAHSAVVVADESCRGEGDLWRIVHEGAAAGVNVKLAKTGVVGALRVIAAVLRANRAEGRRGEPLQLMIGGMVETRLAMGFAAHMAAGLKCFQWVDLDTPLLLASDPVVGGYTMDQDRIVFPPGLGHGGSLRWPAQAAQEHREW